MEGSMFGSREFTALSGFRRILLLAAIPAVLFVAPASTQKDQASSPKYDPHTEAKIKGAVEELRMPPKANGNEIAYLLIKDGTETIDVYLCPRSFLDDMGISYSKGDEIALTGSKVKQGEGDIVLAREVVKGQDTLVLRDEKGKPVWMWHR